MLLPTRRGRLAGLLACAALLALCVVASLAIGSRALPFGEVVRAFTAYDGSDAHAIVRDLRVPRTELGLLVGAALGAAGALMQGVTRNPLAEPGILGINAGAAFAVVLAICVARRLLRLGLHGVRAARRGPERRARPRPRRLGPRRADPGPARARRRRAGDAARLADERGARLRRADARRVPLLDRRLDRRPRRRAWRSPCCRSSPPGSRSRSARGAGSTRWRSATTSPARSASTSAARARRRASASCCSPAARSPPPGPIAFVGLAVPHLARAITGPDYRWIVPYSVVLGAVAAARRRRARAAWSPARPSSRSAS